jgi:hypothetical protein
LVGPLWWSLVPDWSLLPYTKADKTQWPFVANPHA